MSREIFGWDLPPGVRASDIPGNRPEDEAWERITLGFYEGKLTKEEWGKIEPFVEIVDKAIEYGIEVGQRQAEDIRLENKHYETSFVIETLEKSGVSQEMVSIPSQHGQAQYPYFLTTRYRGCLPLPIHIHYTLDKVGENRLANSSVIRICLVFYVLYYNLSFSLLQLLFFILMPKKYGMPILVLVGGRLLVKSGRRHGCLC